MANGLTSHSKHWSFVVRRAVLSAALGCAPIMAAAADAVDVVATTPEEGTRLAEQQPLYVRVRYSSAQPVRFQAAGYLAGQVRDQLYLNAAPVYPAGEGEAVVWLAGRVGAAVDEIRIVRFDSNWKKLGETSVARRAEWRAGVPQAPTAAWARDLMAAQAGLPPPPAREEPLSSRISDAVWMVLVPIAFLSVLAYPVLQVATWFFLRPPLRTLSLLPLAFMLPAYGYAGYALSQGSDLWPLVVVGASPPALLITGIVGVIGLRRRRRESAAPGS